MLQLGLNPLCVTSSTCDLSPLGRANIENLKRLGVDEEPVNIVDLKDLEYAVESLKQGLGDRLASPTVTAGCRDGGAFAGPRLGGGASSPAVKAAGLCLPSSGSARCLGKTDVSCYRPGERVAVGCEGW
jgi:hypothetical protein